MRPDIGLIGLAGSGKDAVAKLLVEKHGYGRVAFADPVKALLLEVDPFVAIDAEWDPLSLTTLVSAGDWDTVKQEPEVRRLIQTLGDGVRRHIDSHAWLIPAMQAAADHNAHGRPVVFSDVRYVNEAEAVECGGCGVLVRVERDGAGLPGVLAQHISELEHASIEAHYTIINDGSLEDLEWAVEALVNNLGDLDE